MMNEQKIAIQNFQTNSHPDSETYMYANFMLPLTLVSNKRNVPFFCMIFQWD